MAKKHRDYRPHTALTAQRPPRACFFGESSLFVFNQIVTLNQKMNHSSPKCHSSFDPSIDRPTHQLYLRRDADTACAYSTELTTNYGYISLPFRLYQLA